LRTACQSIAEAVCHALDLDFRGRSARRS
jgi:hypothetical protein